MLNYYTIYFKNSEKIDNTIDTARIWHGIFFNILKNYSEQISTQYHDKTDRQSFCISPILSEENFNKRCFDKYSSLKINISLFNDEIHKGLFEFIRKNRKVKYGEGQLLIDEISYKSIDENFLDERRVKRGVMNFITPTTFRINPVNSPLPNPRRIFKSLNKSYKDIFGYDLLQDDIIEQVEKHVIVEEFNINTEVAKYSKFNVTGFKGKVTLNLKCPEETVQKKLEGLFALANYVSIGYKTGMGMGQCIVSKK
ncbi:CRISPR-associated endoribonuclease Cas6 [Clostridium sp. A1-XYC3]|uniref:CRISPR-associated endoribonuclease Cas6 n=1 Tax=Clostridium tanneri TaxID=3037988 RepID=A0ABU4JU04_9CLOT|nr:CRISPR-associated endoribonuclease Cas6 [Clostridium sp. A1-XYC3]MDW8801441.1 CRISPR-associated endoribonuclease Cas6 [Clostridium sp. A1-XYC3]